MGVVYLATDLALERQVAIKTLPRLGPQYGARLRREARVMASVSHPNLAVIFGAETWHGVPMLVFEYLAAGTLRDRMGVGRIPVDAAIKLGILLSGALECIHKAGILHRDIKPSNIGYSDAGEPKLLDFGLAKILNEYPVLPEMPADASDQGSSMDTPTMRVLDPVTQTGSRLVGTPGYLAPEAILGQPAGAHFDLWGLSVVLFEAISGRHPFSARTREATLHRIQSGSMIDIGAVTPECPASVKSFLEDSLAVDRRRRFFVSQRVSDGTRETHSKPGSRAA